MKKKDPLDDLLRTLAQAGSKHFGVNVTVSLMVRKGKKTRTLRKVEAKR